MKLEEFAQLMGTSLKEAEEILNKEEVITLNLTEKKGMNSRENFKMEVIR